MIDVSDADIVVERRDSAGRFALFTNTDLPPTCPLPWWSVMLDHGGDASAVLVRLDEKCGPAEAWSAVDLVRAAVARQEAEHVRRPSLMTGGTVWHLKKALAALNSRSKPHGGAPLSFHPGSEPSPYPWTVVQRDDTEDHLDLCPDPAGTGEGISAELLLIVLDQLLRDSLTAFPGDAALARACVHVGRALHAEARRTIFLRARAR